MVNIKIDNDISNMIRKQKILHERFLATKNFYRRRRFRILDIYRGRGNIAA